MSHAKDIAQHCTAICVAAIGLSATTGAITIGAVGLAAAGFEIFKNNQAKCSKAVTRILRDIENSGTENEAVLAEARALISTSEGTVVVNRLDLPRAADSKDFRDAVIDQLMKTFPDSANYDAVRLLRLAMEAAFEACRYEDEFHRPLTQDMLVYISGNTDDLRRGQAAILAALVEINAQADRVTAEERAEWAAREKRLVEKAEAHARELHVNTGLLLALARRYAEDGASDIDSALRGLERALEVAAQRPAGTNLGEEVDAIMAEVDRLNDAGQVAEGGFALKQAMATQRDRNELGKAAMLSLLDKGIAQAVMERSAEDAAACEVERIEIEMLEQTARFDALRSVWQEWYQRGRDKGLNFDLEVSIELAQASTEKARDPGQTGTALNDLGNALWTLGERESGAERLEQAATAYRAALEEWTREKMPLDWAMAQNNLGNVLQTLGERESGTERLEQAVTAFRAALEEGTREKVPLNWATTQNNLGNVFATIGERENDSQRLRQAVTAYRAALEERTRDRVPLEWAVTQNNLGTALKSLGDIEGKRIYAKKAVIAFRAAVEERTREAVPMDWAMTQLNLGGALRTLGESENGTDRLEQAVTAFKAALEELTRERMAIGWAQSQFNLSFLEIAFFRKTGDANHLSRAESYIPGAREVFAETGATQYLAELDVVYNEINHLRNGPSA